MYPTLKGRSTVKQVTDTFYGYNHNLKIGDGEFYDCENMTTDYYPLASSSRKHELWKNFNGNIYGITYNDAFYFVGKESGSDETYLYKYWKKLSVLTGLTAGDKQLVNMGAYICIFPDGAYYNTKDSTDYGYMGCTWDYECSRENLFSYNLCDTAFNDFENIVTSRPAEPTDGQLYFYLEKENATKTYRGILEKYSAEEKTWSNVAYYVKVKFGTQGEIPQKFKVGDTVSLKFPEGAQAVNYETGLSEQLQTFTLLDVGGKAATGSTVGENDYIIYKNEHVKYASYTYTFDGYSSRIYRGIPQMDYVVECQNRLWGCKYGGQYDAQKVFVPYVNEIYACELGNFRNWYKYEGVSTDSWAASIGSDGQWTGAINYNGSPLFFKQDCVHQVTVSSTGAHRVAQLSVPGVRLGCGKSLCIIGNVLYYCSENGVIAYQGGLTNKISSQFGSGNILTNAIAEAKGNKLYIAGIFPIDGVSIMSNQKLYVYDTLKGLWGVQTIYDSETGYIKDMCSGSDTMTIFAATSNGSVYSNLDSKNSSTGFNAVDSWYFESGIFTYNSGSKYRGSYNSGHRYITRFDIRLKMELGAECEMYIEYDSSGTWEFAGRIQVRNTDSFLLPIRPRRCDHMRIKLKGSGDVKIYSITRNLAMGSDNL